MTTDTKPRRAPLFLRLVTPLLSASQVRKLHPAPKTTFILSTGRTGTVYLADLLGQIDGVLSVHEPKPSRVLNAWTTAFLEGHVSNDYMAAALASKRQKTLGDIHVDLYAESNNFIAGFADALEQVFDNPTVIHIVRDPRDFATSLTNRGDDTGIRKLFNQYVPYWAYLPKGAEKRELDALSRAAHRWVAINTYLDEYGTTHKNYYRFKFEDIFNKQDNSELLRLLKAAGLTSAQIKQLDFSAKKKEAQPRLSLLDKPSDSANQSKHQFMQPWRDWSETDARRLQAICGELMQGYGYGTEAAWLKSIRK